jgi:hypothetical protein
MDQMGLTNLFGLGHGGSHWLVAEDACDIVCGDRRRGRSAFLRDEASDVGHRWVQVWRRRGSTRPTTNIFQRGEKPLVLVQIATL